MSGNAHGPALGVTRCGTRCGPGQRPKHCSGWAAEGAAPGPRDPRSRARRPALGGSRAVAGGPAKKRGVGQLTLTCWDSKSVRSRLLIGPSPLCAIVELRSMVELHSTRAPRVAGGCCCWLRLLDGRWRWPGDELFQLGSTVHSARDKFQGDASVGRRGEEFSADVIWASQIGRKWFMGFAELFIALPDMYESRRSTRILVWSLGRKSVANLASFSLGFAMCFRLNFKSKSI